MFNSFYYIPSPYPLPKGERVIKEYFPKGERVIKEYFPKGERGEMVLNNTMIRV